MARSAVFVVGRVLAIFQRYHDGNDSEVEAVVRVLDI